MNLSGLGFQPVGDRGLTASMHSLAARALKNFPVSERMVKEFADVAAVHKDMPFKNVVENAMLSVAANAEATDSAKVKLYVGVCVSPLQLASLCEDYDDYRIIPKMMTHSAHSVAAAARAIDTEILLRMAGACLRIVDIGGNYETHVFKGRDHVHCCCPPMDIRDKARYASREREMRAAAVRGHFAKDKGAVLRRFLENPQKYRCYEKAEECSVKAECGISVHAAYDIPFENIPLIMEKHGMQFYYGTMLYNDIIHFRDEGVIPAVDCHFKVDKANDKITFAFKNDTSLGYKHSLSNYLKYSRNALLGGQEAQYYYEVITKRRSSITFRVTRLPRSEVPYKMPTTQTVACVELSDYIKLRGYKLDRNVSMLSDKALVPYEFIVPRTNWEATTSEVLKLPSARFTLKETMTIAKAYNARLILNGVAVVAKETVQASDLDHFALAVFLYCFRLRYRMIGKTARVVRQELQRRDRVESASALSATMNGLVSRFRAGLLTLGFDGERLCDMMRELLAAGVEEIGVVPEVLTAQLTYDDMRQPEIRPGYMRDFCYVNAAYTERGRVSDSTIAMADPELIRLAATMHDAPTSEVQKLAIEKLTNELDAKAKNAAKNMASPKFESKRSSDVAVVEIDPVGEESETAVENEEDTSGSSGKSGSVTVTSDQVSPSDKRVSPYGKEYVSSLFENIKKQCDKCSDTCLSVSDKTEIARMAIAEYVDYSSTKARAVHETAKRELDSLWENGVSPAYNRPEQSYSRVGCIMQQKLKDFRPSLGSNFLFVRDGYVVRRQFYDDVQHMAGVDVLARDRPIVYLRKERAPEGDYRTKVIPVNGNPVPAIVYVNTSFEIFNDAVLADKARQILRQESFELKAKLFAHLGVAGAGKTYHIIANYMPGDQILVATRSTADEVRREMALLGFPNLKDEVRSIDSYLIHSRRRAKRIFIDEALMVHSGALYAAMVCSQAQEVHCFGDYEQIPFINRENRLMTLNYEHLKHHDGCTFSDVTRRCPQDVVYALSDHYDGRMRTLSDVAVSLEMQEVQGIAGVPYDEGTQYLTFTRVDKAEMIKRGYKNTITVHQSEGATYRNVALVRDDRTTNTLFDSREHALVALTRHTKKLVYYTSYRAGDRVTQLIEKAKAGYGSYYTVAVNGEQ